MHIPFRRREESNQTRSQAGSSNYPPSYSNDQQAIGTLVSDGVSLPWDFWKLSKLDIHTQRYPIRSNHKHWKVSSNMNDIQRPVPPFRIDKRRSLKFNHKNGFVIQFLCDTGGNSNCLTYQEFERLGEPLLAPSMLMSPPLTELLYVPKVCTQRILALKFWGIRSSH